MSFELIKDVRSITGAGMSDVKKALDEAGGDKDKAIEILRKKGQKIAAKKSDREVFVKSDLWVRTGPSTDKLEGQQMIDYIRRNFGKNQQL